MGARQGDSGRPLVNNTNELIGILVAGKEQRRVRLDWISSYLPSSRIFASVSLADPEICSFVQGYLD
jgi:hypothetical protein